MTRVLVGGYAGLGVGEFAGRLTGLTAAVPAGVVERPSYAVVSRDRRWAYAASEITEGKVVALPHRGEGAVSRVRSGGADPCHLALSPGGDLLAVSNYSSGTVGLLSVDGGSLTLVDTVHLTGHGPHPRQRGPHAHQATWLSDTELVVCDLGSDNLVGLTLRGADAGAGAGAGVPRLTHRWTVALPAGTGPRHLVVSREKDRLWVVGELDNTVHLLSRDLERASTARSGGWAIEQTLPLVAPGTAASGGESLTAGIVLGPGGDHLYVTVRGADQLVHFAVDRAGLLREVGRHATAAWPRFVGWLPGNRALVVAAERADQLQCFPVGADGAPGPVEWVADWPEPTSLTR
ncbi:lactonase family protein [Ornithinimicrobium faecis]|uniref:Lactonase family protein n=1 Tax=Ornithinimicrobium faecis TaxID=2934158 RepID=A0ABY4YT10_9MICO|nr:beta-propeller fold lactonase family protein [Ornithinimicrobium sp. HY1793]USQ79903.1 lactonase family protein [Ornithinimicrobium sp. HY1793]